MIWDISLLIEDCRHVNFNSLYNNALRMSTTAAPGGGLFLPGIDT